LKEKEDFNFEGKIWMVNEIGDEYDHKDTVTQTRKRITNIAYHKSFGGGR
jgi:hypothetical protein